MVEFSYSMRDFFFSRWVADVVSLNVFVFIDVFYMIFRSMGILLKHRLIVLLPRLQLYVNFCGFFRQ